MVLFASANCANRKVRRDSRIAAQGVQPLVRNGVTQNSPDIRVSGLFASQSAHTGLALYRSAPFVSKGLFTEYIKIPKIGAYFLKIQIYVF